MSKKLDPRIIRTRQFLRAALLKLIREKGYDAVTIQDITDEAMLNRSTFYMHYQNKDDLMESIITAVLDELAEIPRYKPMKEPNVQYVERIYTSLFQHVHKHHEFYKVMLGERSVAGFMQQLYTHIEALGLKWMAVQRWEKIDTPPELFISFIGAGFLAMINWWLMNDMPYPPEYMARHFMRLTLIGMHRDFGINPDEVTF